MPVNLRLKISYLRVYCNWPNVDSPKTFNEKVLRRIIYDKNKKYGELADKYYR